MSRIKTKKAKRPKLKKIKKVRLAIECSSEERKYMKMYAAHEEKTLNEFVLESVRMRLEKHPRVHIPNKRTLKAIENARKGKTTKAKDFDDLCNQLGI